MSNASTPAAAQPSDLPPDAPRGYVRWLALALAALGWWVSFDLFRLQYGAAATNPVLQLVCQPSGPADRLDCRSVLASDWARVPISPKANAPRIPLSAFGMGYFAFIGLWFLLIGRPTRSRAAWQFVIAGVIAAGLLVSLRYWLVMAQELGQWCAGCVAVHVLNALLAVCVLATVPWRAGPLVMPHPRGSLVMATFIAGGLAFLLHLAVAFIAVQNQLVSGYSREYTKITSDPAYMRWNYERQPVGDIPLEGRPVLGSPQAAHTLVLFGDFQCSRCRSAHATIAPLVAKHPEALRLVMVNCPLDQACYPELPSTPHPHACAAAAAGEAVFQAGGAEAFARWSALAFERQTRMRSAADWSQLAAEAGLDAAAIGAGAASAAVQSRVADDVALARKLGIRQTPAVYLDGRRLDAWERPEQWLSWIGLATAPASAPHSPPGD